VRRDPRITGFVQIAELGPTNEARIARGVKPSAGLTIDNQNDWRACIAWLVIIAVAAVRAFSAVRAFPTRRPITRLAAASPPALTTASTASSIAIRTLAAVLPRAAAVVASSALTLRTVSGWCIATSRLTVTTGSVSG
jgi:hypothetical protein